MVMFGRVFLLIASGFVWVLDEKILKIVFSSGFGCGNPEVSVCAFFCY